MELKYQEHIKNETQQLFKSEPGTTKASANRSKSKVTLLKSNHKTKQLHHIKRRLRNILRHHSVACILFQYISIKQIVTQMHCLNKLTMSKVFRVAMEPSLRILCDQGLTVDDRAWFTLFRTKFYRLMKLNYHNFYGQLSKNTDKLIYNAEI